MEPEPELVFDNRLHYVRGNHIATLDLPPTHPDLCVKRVPSWHPGFPGRGLYATAAIAAGTELGHYAGDVRHVLIADTTPYSFEVNENWVVDAFYHRNQMAYANDPRGTPSEGKPNVGVEQVWLRGALYTIRFVTLLDVADGDELLLNYGSTYNMEMHPSPWLAEREAIDLTLVPVKQEPEAAAAEAEAEAADPHYISFRQAYALLVDQLTHRTPDWFADMERLNREAPHATGAIIHALDKAVIQCREQASLYSGFPSARETHRHMRPIEGMRQCKRCRRCKPLHQGAFDMRRNPPRVPWGTCITCQKSVHNAMRMKSEANKRLRMAGRTLYAAYSVE